MRIVSDGTFEGKTIVEIYDAIGNLKYYNKLEMDEQLSTIVITQVSKYIAGYYFLTIQTPKEVFNFSLVKIGDK